ncbi:hypothetical protein M0P65_06715 [Candidatus Gracilibacteria bacterium]|jgi:hypothetical protein|nr:hypothetical protein [Candidatus Gracilibacteria bacterium]
MKSIIIPLENHTIMDIKKSLESSFVPWNVLLPYFKHISGDKKLIGFKVDEFGLTLIFNDKNK